MYQQTGKRFGVMPLGITRHRQVDRQDRESDPTQLASERPSVEYEGYRESW